MIDTYTRLLEAVAEQGDDTARDSAVKKLILHLKSAGRVKMLPEILRELKKIAARKEALTPYLEVAHQKEAEHALREAATAGVEASRAHVNHSLVHGWRVRGNGRLIDRSGKRMLVDIYKKSITPYA